jgi:hypothetical protein
MAEGAGGEHSADVAVCGARSNTSWSQRTFCNLHCRKAPGHIAEVWSTISKDRLFRVRTAARADARKVGPFILALCMLARLYEPSLCML